MYKRFVNLFNCLVLFFCTPVLVDFDMWLWKLGSSTPLPNEAYIWFAAPTFVIFLVAALQQLYFMVSSKPPQGTPVLEVVVDTLGYGLWPIIAYVIFAVLVTIVIAIFPSTLKWNPWYLLIIFALWIGATAPTIFKGAIAVVGVIFALLVGFLR